MISKTSCIFEEQGEKASKNNFALSLIVSGRVTKREKLILDLFLETASSCCCLWPLPQD